METFGEWLYKQRSLRRLTREEFTKRVGCSVSALCKIEYGERRPSAQIAELMANCLDVPPEERSTFVRVARGELSVDRLDPAWKPVATKNISPQKTNLPIFPTPLIGRERELEQLSQLLGDPQCRLLTLVGPGGIGKTRLSIETATQLENDFRDGVYFVPLAPVNSSRYIVPVIADSIGFNFQGAIPTDPKTQLLNYLKEKHILLLVDNLEHLLNEQSATEFVVELIQQAPRIKLITTSRESLNLQDEWVFEVQGLPVPESEDTEGTSVELFLQRARRAHVGFTAPTDDYPAILRICTLVDGMPLGIELAAAWVRTLSCVEIAKEIERGLGFLSVAARDLPARHRSMRAVFDHSWKLLSEEEQKILMRLSAFRGGFRREAAEQVAGATLSVLSALVTKSLIRRKGAGRYDLHELIRQFAAEQFAEHLNEQAATQVNHSRYYLTFFGQADGRLRSSAQRETLAELTTEMDNFRAAWDWALTHGEFALIEQTMRTFTMLYDNRGWCQEGLDILDHAINALEMDHAPARPNKTNQVALAHILACRSYIAFRLTQVELAQEMLERSLEILRPMNEPRVLVESLAFLGLVMIWIGNYSRALELFTEGRETATTIHDRWFFALCLTQQANVSVMMGNSENGHAQLQTAVANWRQIGDLLFTAYALNLLSLSALALGRYAEARASLEECITLYSSVGGRWGLGFGYQGLGRVAQAQGQHRHAVEMFSKGLETFKELGARRDIARALAEMGRSLLAVGDDDEAGRVWRDSLRLAIETRGSYVALEALAGLASLQAKQGDIEHALELLLMVLNHPASLQETKNRADRLRAELEAQLSPAQIEAIQAHAGEKTFEAVVEDLLK